MTLLTLPTAPETEKGENPRIRSIDGLRAVAVLAVIGYHFGAGPTGGFLGVDLFFVISGFVITRLLLHGKTSGTLTMRRFYVHRVRRLLPALLCLLCAVQLWVLTADLPAMLPTVNSQTLAALAFVGNWYTIHADVNYWSVQPDNAPLNHLWSLAVEEQYYLVWPVLVTLAVVRDRGPRVTAILAGIGALLSYALAAWAYVPGQSDRAYLGTDTRAGALCLGALAACATTALASRARKRWADERALAATVLVSGCVLAALWCQAAIDDWALYLWQLPMAGLSAAVLVSALAILDQPGPGHGRHPAVKAILGVIASRSVISVGTISYGLYLWHWPVWMYIKMSCSAWLLPTQQCVALALSFGIAALSYICVESPARHCRLRTLLVSVVCVCLVISAFALVAPTSGNSPSPTEEGPVVSGIR